MTMRNTNARLSKKLLKPIMIFIVLVFVFLFALNFPKIREKLNKSKTSPLDEIVANVEEYQSVISYLESQNLYYYNNLDDTLKEDFAVMYYGVINNVSTIKLSTNISRRDFEKLVYILQFDCPEIFNIAPNYTYDISQGYVTTFYPSYRLEFTEYREMFNEINIYLENILDKCKDMDDYEKELYIHDFILTHTVYDSESDNNENMYGCLINGRANCKGYTAAFSYILRKLDIQSTAVIGEITDLGKETTGHTWNLVKINDEYVYADICWDDITSEDFPYISYHYTFLNMTYGEMLRIRNISKQLKYLGEIPKTESTTLSYYKNNGMYANNYSEAKDIIENNLPLYLSSQKDYFVIQCKNEDTYDALLKNIENIIKKLIDDGDISITSCTYSKIDSGYTLIIHNFS